MIPDHDTLTKDHIGEYVCAKIRVNDYEENPKCINKQFTAPLDMVNLKNIQNLRILRQMAFRIY